jgi:hypothetical protein
VPTRFGYFVENSDIEIVEAMIIALHELLQYQCHVSMMAVAFRLSKSKNLGSVFDRLNSRFNEYSNLFPLLSGFALQFTDSQRTKLCNAIITLCDTPNFGSLLRLHPHRIWFFFPMLLAFRCNSN